MTFLGSLQGLMGALIPSHPPFPWPRPGRAEEEELSLLHVGGSRVGNIFPRTKEPNCPIFQAICVVNEPEELGLFFFFFSFEYFQRLPFLLVRTP